MALREIRGSLGTEYSGLRRRVVGIAAYLTRYYVMTSHPQNDVICTTHCCKVFCICPSIHSRTLYLSEDIGKNYAEYTFHELQNVLKIHFISKVRGCNTEEL